MNDISGNTSDVAYAPNNGSRRDHARPTLGANLCGATPHIGKLTGNVADDVAKGIPLIKFVSTPNRAGPTPP